MYVRFEYLFNLINIVDFAFVMQMLVICSIEFFFFNTICTID